MSRSVDRELGKLEGQAEQARVAHNEWTAELDRKWEAAAAEFRQTHPHLLGPDHHAQFTTFLTKVTGDDLWATKSYQAQLREAAEQYARFAGNPALSKATGTAPQPEPTKKAGKKGGARAQTPPVTLGRLPNADEATTGMTDFQHIEAAMAAGDTGLVESMVAALSPTQRDRWLKGF